MIKKYLSLLLVFLIVLGTFGCTTERNNEENLTMPLYKIDFEDRTNIEYVIACFNEVYTERFLSFVDNVDGLDGYAYKAKVSEPEPNDTWWVSGIKFLNNDSTNASDFKNLEKVTFKYKSTVSYCDQTQFMVQLAWKDKTSGMSVLEVWVDFPIESTSTVKTFTIDIDSEDKEILDNTDNYYFDWIMIGLEAAAGIDFNVGTFYIDDICFWDYQVD